jgi:hypothetical protein
MVRFENDEFAEVVEKNEFSEAKLAILADMSPTSFKKILNGDTDLRLCTLDKCAGFMGFDVEVRLVRKPAEVV